MLRRRRWRRLATKSLAAAVVIAGAVFSVQKLTAPRLSTSAVISTAADQVHELTDDEWLALFPNTPVGLATLENGKLRLIFPRPGDEQEFITRL